MSASSTAPISRSPSRTTASTGCSPAKRIEASSTAAFAPRTAPVQPPKIAPIGPPRKKPMVPPVAAPTVAPAAASASWAIAGGMATDSAASATPKARNLRMFFVLLLGDALGPKNAVRLCRFRWRNAAAPTSLLDRDRAQPRRDGGPQRSHRLVDGPPDDDRRK